ncbi:phosphoprotein [Wenling dimarhabdovirus 1]|uniref:Phosphoprotein n=1 Tax=Wenling dimarhabdovirus 1 TaxID=2116359 RepID=A0A2P1GMS3_9RHAB|nr:phosphoprotein [Wenling dimarhabdovirus 1]
MKKTPSKKPNQIKQETTHIIKQSKTKILLEMPRGKRNRSERGSSNQSKDDSLSSSVLYDENSTGVKAMFSDRPPIPEENINIVDRIKKLNQVLDFERSLEGESTLVSNEGMTPLKDIKKGNNPDSPSQAIEQHQYQSNWIDDIQSALTAYAMTVITHPMLSDTNVVEYTDHIIHRMLQELAIPLKQHGLGVNIVGGNLIILNEADKAIQPTDSHHLDPPKIDLPSRQSGMLGAQDILPSACIHQKRVSEVNVKNPKTGATCQIKDLAREDDDLIRQLFLDNRKLGSQLLKKDHLQSGKTYLIVNTMSKIKRKVLSSKDPIAKQVMKEVQDLIKKSKKV